MKKYRWNARKCAANMAALVAFVAAGLVVGWVFALWALA
jgi:hypothetical protein